MYQPSRSQRSIKTRKIHILCSIFLLIAISSAIAQETVDSKEPRWKQLGQAYGFVLGQQSALELIEKTFPDLTTSVKEAWFAFNSTALGESTKGVEAELSKELGEKWPEYKTTVTTQMDELVGKQEPTRQQAVDFLAEVKKRSKGNLPESIRSTLLSAHPRYSKNQALELADGWKQTFRTKGHTKAKGVDVSVSFPASWSKREGNRPNVVQFFRSGAGHGSLICTLLIRDLSLTDDYELTNSEIKEFFKPEELQRSTPAGAIFVDAKEIVLEGSPAGILVFDQTQQRLDVKFTMRMTQFVVIHGHAMVFLQFAFAKMPDSGQTLEELQNQFRPTIMAIANTYVWNDLYK